MPEVAIGIPSVVEAALLPKLIGQGRARRLLLTGETIGAAEALDWGLVDSVAPADGLDEAVERLGAPILAAGPRAIRLQKSLILDWEELPTRSRRSPAASTSLSAPSIPTSRRGWPARRSPGCTPAAIAAGTR